MTASRRAFLQLGLIGFGATLVAACSNSSPTPANPTAAPAQPAATSASAPSSAAGSTTATAEAPTTAASAATSTTATTPAAAVAAPTTAAAATQAPAAETSGQLQAATLVWWQNDGQQSNRIDPVTKQFMQQHPNIQVQMLVIPNDLALKLAPSAAAGTLPDIFYARTFTTADYAIKGWLYSINDYVTRDAQELNLSDLDPLMTIKEKWKGKWYTLPENFSDLVVYYNKKMFDDAKVTYPKDSWTWSDFRETGKQFIKTDSSSKQTQFGADIGIEAADWVNWGMLLGNGGQIVSEDLKKAVVNSSQNVATLQFLSDLIHVDKVAPAPNQLPQGMDPFGSSAVAMHVGGSWEIARLRDTIKDKFDWDVAAIPMGSTGKYGVNVEGGAYGIGGSTKYPDDAWALLKFSTTTQAIETEVNKILFSLPGRISAREDWVKVAQTDQQPPAHATVFFDILKNTTPEVPVLPYYTEFSRAYDNRIAGIFSGDHKASEVLPQLEDELNGIIAKYQF